MISLAHVHLLLNHLPVILTPLGLVLLAIAARRRDDSLSRVAFAVLIAAAVTAVPTYFTGEEAEHAIKGMAGVTKAVIGRHEDMGRYSAIFLGALGLFLIWALWRHRPPVALPSWVVRSTLAASLVGSVILGYTSLLGGEVRHTEIRPGFVADPNAQWERGPSEPPPSPRGTDP